MIGTKASVTVNSILQGLNNKYNSRHPSLSNHWELVARRSEDVSLSLFLCDDDEFKSVRGQALPIRLGQLHMSYPDPSEKFGHAVTIRLMQVLANRHNIAAKDVWKELSGICIAQASSNAIVLVLRWIVGLIIRLKPVRLSCWRMYSFVYCPRCGIVKPAPVQELGPAMPGKSLFQRSWPKLQCWACAHFVTHFVGWGRAVSAVGAPCGIDCFGFHLT